MDFTNHNPNHKENTMPADTCHATGQTYAELDYFNIGTEERDQWVPFVNEETYLEWMADNGRPIPSLQSF